MRWMFRVLVQTRWGFTHKENTSATQTCLSEKTWRWSAQSASWDTVKILKQFERLQYNTNIDHYYETWSIEHWALSIECALQHITKYLSYDKFIDVLQIRTARYWINVIRIEYKFDFSEQRASVGPLITQTNIIYGCSYCWICGPTVCPTVPYLSITPWSY